MILILIIKTNLASEKLFMSSHHLSPCVMSNTDQFFVRVCGCGVVHLSFGCATINVSSKTAIAITETLKEVTLELRRKLDSMEQLNEDTAAIDSNGNVVYGNFQLNK